jgi:hypothetical protein
VTVNDEVERQKKWQIIEKDLLFDCLQSIEECVETDLGLGKG